MIATEAGESTYRLDQEQWAPVVDGGRTVEVSILETLREAHHFQGLALDNPPEAVAVLRQVLLPAYLDIFGMPSSRQEWLARWDAGHLDPDKIHRYFAEHGERFDLFGRRPFAQVGDLRTAKGETRPVSLLIAAAPTGNNVPLFAARTEADAPELTPAQAARAVLATHCWDTAAIKSGAVGDPVAKSGKTTGNPTGPLGQLGVTVPLGRTLYETLLLNTPVHREGRVDGDLPQWRRDQGPAWKIRPSTGLLDLLTWQSRRIRLFPERAADGHLFVRQVIVAGGDRLAVLPKDEEIHTAWRQVPKPKAGDPSQRPIRHQPGRAAWRGLAALLAVARQTNNGETSTNLLIELAGLQDVSPQLEQLPLQVLTVGVRYGNQSAVVEDVMSDLIPLPVLALNPEGEVRALLVDIVNQAEELRRAANRLEDNLREAAGGDPLQRDKGSHLGESLLYELSPVVRRLLSRLQHTAADDADVVGTAEAGWKAVAYRTALEVARPQLDSVPPASFLGRAREGRTGGPVMIRAATAESIYRGALRAILQLPRGTEHGGTSDAA